MAHPSGQPDQDWHTQLHGAPTEPTPQWTESNARIHIHRALSMAQRAVGRGDWALYDRWLAEADRYRQQLNPTT